MKLYTLFAVFSSQKEEKSTNEEPSKEQNNHFGRVYFDVLNNEPFKKLSPLAIKIYVSMLEYADWKTGLCWPSQSLIAENCGCSRRMVIRKIKELEENGYIKKQSKNGRKSTYQIIAYKEHTFSSEPVNYTSQGGVTPVSQGCEPHVTGGVTPMSHEQYTVTKVNNDSKQQEHNLLGYDDLIKTTSNGDKPVTVESVCCKISDIFLEKFGARLPLEFVREKIKVGEVFDDQFYIQIIMTQQRMPDNPIGWWRSVDETWVLDENARPVDKVGRGWRMYTTTEEFDPEEAKRGVYVVMDTVGELP